MKKPAIGAGRERAMSEHQKQDFIEELNALCHRHGLYLSILLDQEGIHVLPIEPHMRCAVGYSLQKDDQPVEWCWY